MLPLGNSIKVDSLLTIELSNHAIQRIHERIGCSPSKYLKLALKAWRSITPVPSREVTNQRFYEKEKFSSPNKKFIYKKHLGQIWVFEKKTTRNVAVLITVAKPAPKPRRKVLFIRNTQIK